MQTVHDKETMLWKSHKLFLVKVVETYEIPIQAQSAEDAAKYLKNNHEWIAYSDTYIKTREFETMREITSPDDEELKGFEQDELPWGYGIFGYDEDDKKDDCVMTVAELFSDRTQLDDDVLFGEKSCTK